MRPEPNHSKPRLLITAREAAEALGISPRTLWALTAPRGSLAAVRIGRRVFYRPQDLEQFVNNQLVKPVEGNTNGNASGEDVAK
jgi:excisionase family DNA binding protein